MPAAPVAPTRASPALHLASHTHDSLLDTVGEIGGMQAHRQHTTHTRVTPVRVDLPCPWACVYVYSELTLCTDCHSGEAPVWSVDDAL